MATETTGVTAVLLLSCPDQRGIVAAVANFIVEHNGNVVHADQHGDLAADGKPVFFQRVEFELAGFDVTRDEIGTAFAPVAERFGMHTEVRFSDERIPTAIMASRQPHCLADLLVRWSSGELDCDLRVVVSNHPDHAQLCAGLGVPYVCHPVTEHGDAPQNAKRTAFVTSGEPPSRVAISSRAATPDPLSLMPGPSGTESRCAPTSTTCSVPPLRV